MNKNTENYLLKSTSKRQEKKLEKKRENTFFIHGKRWQALNAELADIQTKDIVSGHSIFSYPPNFAIAHKQVNLNA